MISHTPTPWTVEEIDGIDNGASVSIVHRRPDGSCILIANVMKTDDSIHHWSGDKEGQVNAQIMVAAPRLLASLKALVGMVEGLDGFDPSRGQYGHAEMVEAHFAVHMAEGRGD